MCIFPEGELTPDGEIKEFRRGVDHIVKRSQSPVIPLAIKGLWGSYFSRYKGRACQGLPTRFRSNIEIEAAAPLDPETTTSEQLRTAISELRADWK